jgi:murein DD-endopeptidase MepM/ murein hydrolase activator NlpD
MPKNKYILNPITLQYEEEKISWKESLYSVLKYLFFVVICTISLIYFLSEFYHTPKEVKLNAELNNVKFDYKVLDKKVTDFSNALTKLEERENNVYKLIFNPNPLSQKSDNPITINVDLGVEKSEYQSENHEASSNFYSGIDRNMHMIQKRLYKLSKSYDVILYQAQNKDKMMRSRPAIFPIALSDLDRISSDFGARFHPHYKRWKKHTGIDMTAEIGVPIYATADGVVSKVQSIRTGYGKNVRLNHGYGYMTLYGHCSEILVQVGQKVKRGQIIAKVGNTGISTGPHVHYEVRVNDIPKNPRFYFFNEVSDDDYKNHTSIVSNTEPQLK